MEHGLTTSVGSTSTPDGLSNPGQCLFKKPFLESMPKSPNHHTLNSDIIKLTCHSVGYPPRGMCVKRWQGVSSHQNGVSHFASPATCPAAFHLSCSPGFPVPSPWPYQAQATLCTGSRGRLLKEWLGTNTNPLMRKAWCWSLHRSPSGSQNQVRGNTLLLKTEG